MNNSCENKLLSWLLEREKFFNEEVHNIISGQKTSQQCPCDPIMKSDEAQQCPSDVATSVSLMCWACKLLVSRVPQPFERITCV